MYLLRRESDGEFSLTEYYGQLPPYAILSHTWGSDDEEVTFKDILKSRGKRKSGYEKLRFCAAQAEEDGLEYFWVDTCCIDKTDSVKLSEAINSMFSWYQHSTRCYVYLSDVDALPITLDLFRNRELLEHVLAPAWKSDFKLSKWFTRGWTLQELLAPSSVEFFAKNGERLGDKQTLSQDIHQITAISLEALEESPLRPSGYSVKERLSWAEGRETKREEDAVYSLLGLFGVHMSPIYGEGRPNAYDRLLLEIQRKSALRPSHGTGSSDLQDAAFSSNGQHGNGPLTLKRSASDAFGATLSGPDESDSKHRLVEAKSEKSARDRTEEHLVAMRDWFTEAIAARMDLPSGYQRVAVLLFRWTDELDELRTSNEVSELQRVFRDEFQFETEIVGLNHRSKPQLQMDRSLITFIEEYDGPQNLLIVFYAGSSVRYQSTRRLELLPSLSSLTDRGAFTGGQINWYKTEDMLRSDEVDGDVLAILDTPYASNNEVGHIFNEENNYKGGDERTSRRFQLMAACDETTSGAENQSFTRALIDGMMRLLKDDSCPSFSTQKLHQSIEKVSARSGTTSLIWSLLPNKDHIFLAPLEFSATRRSKARLRGRGYLKLGLEIRDASLEEPQIEYLAGALSALLDKELIGLRRIDWLGFEPRKEALMSFTEHLSLRKSAAHQWKRIVAKKKQEAMDQREYTLRKEWRGTKEVLGLESKPPTSPPSDTCAG